MIVWGHIDVFYISSLLTSTVMMKDFLFYLKANKRDGPQEKYTIILVAQNMS